MKRIGMMSIKEILRHRHGLGLPLAQLGVATGVSAGTVSHVLERASAAGLAEAVALDVLQIWISDLHRTVEERAGTLDIADGDQLDKWREGLRVNRIAPARHRAQGLERFNTALAVVEKLRLIETQLADALSADLRAALAFSRGGAAAGSR